MVHIKTHSVNHQPEHKHWALISTKWQRNQPSIWWIFVILYRMRNLEWKPHTKSPEKKWLWSSISKQINGCDGLAKNSKPTTYKTNKNCYTVHCLMVLHSQVIKDNLKKKNEKIQRTWFLVSPEKGAIVKDQIKWKRSFAFIEKNKGKRSNNDWCCIPTFPASAKSQQHKADGKRKVIQNFAWKKENGIASSAQTPRSLSLEHWTAGRCIISISVLKL